MKKFVIAILATLALNFVALVGGVAYLAQTGKLDRTKALAIKEIVFPKAEPSAAPATQPTDTASAATTQPSTRLDELLAKYSGRSGPEQVEFIQQSFDAQMAQLDRRQRELVALQQSVDNASRKLGEDRAKLLSDRQALANEKNEAERLAGDKGFQDALQLYTALPAKQVKTIFMTLDDKTVTSFLQNMEPRPASRIIKEFKTPDEEEKIKTVLEMMRRAQEQQNPTAQAPPSQQQQQQQQQAQADQQQPTALTSPQPSAASAAASTP